MFVSLIAPVMWVKVLLFKENSTLTFLGSEHKHKVDRNSTDTHTHTETFTLLPFLQMKLKAAVLFKSILDAQAVFLREELYFFPGKKVLETDR